MFNAKTHYLYIFLWPFSSSQTVNVITGLGHSHEIPLHHHETTMKNHYEIPWFDPQESHQVLETVATNQGTPSTAHPPWLWHIVGLELLAIQWWMEGAIISERARGKYPYSPYIPNQIRNRLELIRVSRTSNRGSVLETPNLWFFPFCF